jgi:hypothetical protein
MSGTEKNSARQTAALASGNKMVVFLERMFFMSSDFPYGH